MFAPTEKQHVVARCPQQWARPGSVGEVRYSYMSWQRCCQAGFHVGMRLYAESLQISLSWSGADWQALSFGFRFFSLLALVFATECLWNMAGVHNSRVSLAYNLEDQLGHASCIFRWIAWFSIIRHTKRIVTFREEHLWRVARNRRQTTFSWVECLWMLFDVVLLYLLSFKKIVSIRKHSHSFGNSFVLPFFTSARKLVQKEENFSWSWNDLIAFYTNKQRNKTWSMKSRQAQAVIQRGSPASPTDTPFSVTGHDTS